MTEEEKGFIGIDKVKTLLEDISVGTDPVTVKSAEEFLKISMAIIMGP